MARPIMPPTEQTFQFCRTMRAYDAAMLSGVDKAPRVGTLATMTYRRFSSA
jgi:hypothetical protein